MQDSVSSVALLGRDGETNGKKRTTMTERPIDAIGEIFIALISIVNIANQPLWLDRLLLLSDICIRNAKR